jgi:hypothetical protein
VQAARTMAKASEANLIGDQTRRVAELFLHRERQAPACMASDSAAGTSGLSAPWPEVQASRVSQCPLMTLGQPATVQDARLLKYLWRPAH